MALVLKGRTLLKGSTIIGRRPYALFGIYNPELILDFQNEYYRTNSAASTFSDAVTHSRTGNATMVDADGLLKWAPHNTQIYSEDIAAGFVEQGVSVAANQTTAPDGALTADKCIVLAGAGSRYFKGTSQVYTVGPNYVWGVYFKYVDWQYVWLDSFDGVTDHGYSFDILNGTLGSPRTGGATGTAPEARITDVGAGWYLCEMEFTATDDGSGFTNQFGFIGTGGAWTNINVTGDGVSSFYAWGAHSYRSDLGGMVNNPDRGDSYVPTTTAAVYSPRRGNHVYNGSAWVNEGLLHESAAATNLVTYSEDFTDASWVKSNTATLALDAIGPDGQANSAVTFVDSGIGGTGVVSIKSTQTLVAGTTYTFSCVAEADQLSWLVLGVSGFTTPSGFPDAWFNLLAGTKGMVEAGIDGSTIENLGSGRYRCSIQFTPSGADLTGDVSVIVGDGDGVKVVDLDGTSSILIYGAQLEASSAPTSYIPTAGATATRAAETLTVPIANVPYPVPVEVTGTELVTNGTFDTDLTGWINSNWAWSDGKAATTGVFGTLRQFIGEREKPKLIGIEYTKTSSRLQMQLIDSTAVNPTVALGGAVDLSTLGVSPLSIILPIGYDTIQFTTTDATAVWTIDNISVKEINPLAVSIQMDGQMTYADNSIGANTSGGVGEVVFHNWKLDASNYNEAILGTNGTDVGKPTFVVEASAVRDFVVGDPAQYTPGINVPFNIASRSGSTFLNGAVDGTALTADLTPVAFPDLSATDIDIGTTFIGNIGKFIMWGDTDGDIGDIGIAGATLPSLEPSLSLTFDGSETSFTVLDWSA